MSFSLPGWWQCGFVRYFALSLKFPSHLGDVGGLRRNWELAKTEIEV